MDRTNSPFKAKRIHYSLKTYRSVSKNHPSEINNLKNISTDILLHHQNHQY